MSLADDYELMKGMFSAVQSLASIGGWEYNVVDDQFYWTDEIYHIYETTPEEYVPTRDGVISLCTTEEATQKTHAALTAAIQTGEDFSIEIEQITLKGNKLWVQAYAKTVMVDGKVVKLIGATQDITARKAAELEIYRHGNFDQLTELPNRRMFRYCLGKEIIKSAREGKMLALLFIDLDHFKEINDTFGHSQGDAVIKKAAQRITSCVRESDTVARLGGDEYTIIIAGLEEYTTAERIASGIMKRLAEPFQIGEEVAYLSASVGITLYPEDGINMDDLLMNADQAMYVAKKSGRNRYQYYTSSMHETAVTRGLIANNLRAAIANNEFYVVYQPIVDLSNGEIHKAEALLRWEHPKRGLISPAEFIPIAEETGLISEIGEWVFQEAARQVKSWRASYDKDFQISVNTSPIQYHDANNRLNMWIKYLRTLGLPGTAVVAEITEGVLMDTHSEIVERLQAFRDVGIQVSLDDFGTGYSSLSYLRKFDIDYIKIDQSFVRNMKSDSKDIALCDAIIAMAHKLDIKVIAEGIETEEHRDLLTASGCDYGQGYLFSKPVVPKAFQKLLTVRS